MGGAYSTHVMFEKCIQNIGHKIQKGGDHLEDQSIGGRIILGWILKKQVLRIWSGFISLSFL
jgi:hypothetical protein